MTGRSRDYYFILLYSLGINVGLSQVLISPDAQLVTTRNTTIAINTNLIDNSTQADLSNATLVLTGQDQSITNGFSGSSVLLGGLIVGEAEGSNNGIKSILGGTWEIAGSLIFNDGVIVPQSGSNGKIMHTIGKGAAGDVLVNNPLSYVNGTFYSKGYGTRIFPIGNNTGYFPAQLFSVTQNDIEIGMRVVSSNPALTYGSEILDVFSERYWELSDPSQTLSNATVALSAFETQSFIDPTIGTIVVGSSGTGGEAVSLGGAQSGDFIVGSTGITVSDRIFTLGKVGSDQVSVKIHNVITPFLDNANDYLQIDNIDIFPENKVMLIDRWGVKVREWTDFSNVFGTPDSAHDLSKVATGNYICVVEYKDGGKVKKLSQMITIINQ